MDNITLKTRIAGPDLVRSIAALFVVSVHYFFNCGYYNAAMNSRTMIIMTALRWLFLTCVPIYMMLTGYFKCNKELNKAHYMGLIPVFVAYIVISTIKVFAGNHYYGKVYGIKEALQSMGNYTIAWYVGFYFSLMAISPFLNKMWHALKSKKEQHILIISLLLVTGMYPLVSLLAVSTVTPLTYIGSILEIIAPNYWQMMYPLLYYFIGCYLRENKPRVNKLLLLTGIIATVLCNTAISYHYANGGPFIWSILGTVDCGYNCVTVAICATCIFMLFYDVDIRNRITKKILQIISEVSLEIYLFSAIFDIIIFDYAKSQYSAMSDYLRLFLVLVPINFIGSLICSRIYKLIYDSIKKLIIK